MTLMTEEETAAARSSYNQFLKDHVASVTFRKVNGEMREMRCTLMPQYIPETVNADPKSEKRVREAADTVVVAYDLDKNDWRSFRVDSVVAIHTASAA
jgi:hypothetical protein